MTTESRPEMVRRQKRSRSSSLLGLQVAVGFLLVGLLVQSSSRAYYYRLEKLQLSSQIEQLKSAVTESEKARQQLEGLAAKTAALAEEGNKSAVVIVNKFKAAGIALNNPEP